LKDMPFATAPSGERTIALSGDLDIAVRARLQERFEDALAEAVHITVDMTNVTYMDSSAIGALIWLYRELEEREGSLRILLRKNAAYRLLEIAGLTNVLTLEIVS
jgi:anti-sigma B factor antagonist